ncbi:hypothetical protein E3J39_00420 [Candidatus Bathyarchaeota archaeon]|nr:MAG: hypothetical protein E3J39_00420 [Candidatus Bathyarchaeota archaeon]
MEGEDGHHLRGVLQPLPLVTPPGIVNLIREMEQPLEKERAHTPEIVDQPYIFVKNSKPPI